MLRTGTWGSLCTNYLISYLFPMVGIVVLFDLTCAKLLLEGGLCRGVQHFLPANSWSVWTAKSCHPISLLLVYTTCYRFTKGMDREYVPRRRIIWGPCYQCPVKGLRCISFIQPKENIARLVILKQNWFMTSTTLICYYSAFFSSSEKSIQDFP